MRAFFLYKIYTFDFWNAPFGARMIIKTGTLYKSLEICLQSIRLDMGVRSMGREGLM